MDEHQIRGTKFTIYEYVYAQSHFAQRLLILTLIAKENGCNCVYTTKILMRRKTDATIGLKHVLFIFRRFTVSLSVLIWFVFIIISGRFANYTRPNESYLEITSAAMFIPVYFFILYAFILRCFNFYSQSVISI